MTAAVPVYDGPRPADLVEAALAAYRRHMHDRRLPPWEDVGEFVLRYLAARGVEVRPITLDDVPDEVAEAVADLLTPDDLGSPNSADSELVGRVMRATYAATRAHLSPENPR